MPFADKRGKEDQASLNTLEESLIQVSHRDLK